MKRRLAITAALLCLAAAPVWAQDDSAIVQGRLEIREAAQDSLATLYEIQPAARSLIEHAAGYGVFSTGGADHRLGHQVLQGRCAELIATGNRSAGTQ